MNFRSNKKFVAIAFITVMVTGGVAAIRAPRFQPRNLKVLPQDISDQKLDSIMHSYNYALGVDCKFCHAGTDAAKTNLDFASDKEPMKENARSMITMMIDINKRYFWYDTTKQAAYLNTVACYTCHRGEEMPPDNSKPGTNKPVEKRQLFPFGGK